MKFKYRLQKVLEYRQTLEDIAQREFQEAQAQLLKEEDHLKFLENQAKMANLQRGEIQENSVQMSAETLKQIHEFLMGQKILIEKQVKLIQVIAKVVEEKRLALVEKVTETKVLEKLKEKKLSEHKLEYKQKEQAENDELSILRFQPKS